MANSITTNTYFRGTSSYEIGPRGVCAMFLKSSNKKCERKLYVLSCALLFSGLKLDILVTQSPKCLRQTGLQNQFSFVYIVAKC